MNCPLPVLCLALLVAAPFVGNDGARADEPPSHVVAAIEEKAAQIPDELNGYYAKRLHDAPVADADDAAHLFFTGVLGDGAIYWSEVGGVQLLYGDMLDLYFARVRRGGPSYPSTARLPGPGDGCLERTVIARQRVSRRVSNGIFTEWLCVGPSGAYVPIICGL